MSRNLIAFDTEDVDGDLKLAVFFDGDEYTICYDKFQAREFIFESRYCDFWAHNLEYDLINVFQDAFDELGEMIYSGSKIILAKRKTNRFYDTMNHYMGTLKKIGEGIGLEKIDVDGDFINVEYCMRDAEIVYEFVCMLDRVYGEYNVKVHSTKAAVAIKIFKRNFFAGTIKVPDADTIIELRQGYYGGRCEIFRMGEIRKKVIRKYDVNSLYPYVMKEMDYPIPDIPIRIKSLPIYGVSKVKVTAPDMEFPILPIKISGKLIFPIGQWVAVYPMNLLNYAIDNGYSIEKVYWSISYNGPCKPFGEYVDELYPKRKGSDMNSIIYKFLLNTLYGKFAQGNQKTIVEVMKNERNEQYLHITEETGNYPRWSNHIWSIYVTGYALIEIHQWIDRLSRYGEILYCDTDGVVVAGGKEMKTSDKLGDMKLDEVGRIFEAKSPKVYRLDNDYKAKGIPKDSRMDFFTNGVVKFKRPIRLRESFIQDLKPNVWMEKEKRRISEYDKRRVLPDGRTRPLLLGKGRNPQDN